MIIIFVPYAKKTLQKGDVPKFAVFDCIRKNKSIATLKTINELEERLVALRFPFLQIRELGLRYQKPQLGLSGGVINVHADISRIQHAFPRKINESDTNAIAIKRSLKFKNAYAIGRIHPHLVIKALKQLCKRTLYKLEKVTIIDKWNEEFMQNIKAYETEIDIED